MYGTCMDRGYTEELSVTTKIQNELYSEVSEQFSHGSKDVPALLALCHAAKAC